MTASLGLGGGFVLLLYLTAIAGMEQMNAQGINLIFFLPIALLSLCIHWKHHLVEKEPLLPAILCGLAGVLAGSFLAFRLPVEWLSKLFAAFLLVVGIRETFFPKKQEKKEDSENKET